MIYLQNTLSGKKEEFTPIKEGEVSMYNCGPTVYDFAHIGNFRTFILYDLLRRMFEYNNYNVNQVMNITDVDDKTIKRSRSEHVSLGTLTIKYEAIFLNDLKSLNILPAKKTPRATESISDMIELIETLLQKEIAYKSSDGIYFDISKSKNYGQLSGLRLDNLTRERIANDEYDKASPRDFALWKFYTDEDGDVAYDAPFGKGRPGWHIECSAMSMKALGETIDVHAGGQDLLFPHHTNEIAQSEGATGKTFVNYWVHGGMITIDGKKMAKSLDNFFTLESLREKGIDPMAYRYFVLGAHYSSLLNFTWEAVEGAQVAWKKLHSFMSKKHFDSSTKTVIVSDYVERFVEYINDDLNMPQALALVWEIVKNDELEDSQKRKLILDFDKVLGLKLDEPMSRTVLDIPENVQNLVTERDLARSEKNFVKSDELREKIEELGFEVMDTLEGTEVIKK